MQNEEQRLIRRILEGHVEAYATLIERYNRPIFALVARIVEQREEAEELTQDIFLKAYSKLSTFRAQSSFSTWLYRIACNMALSSIRSKQQRFRLLKSHQTKQWIDEFEDADEITINEAQIEVLLEALDRLSPEERTLIQLHYYENRPLSECGEILSLTETNTKVRLHRIRKKLGLWISEKQ